MTLLQWDHTMINVVNLERAIDFFERQGITFQPGGHHENWGTKNALAYFGLNYIELLTVEQLPVASKIKRSEAAAIYDAVFDYQADYERINTVAIRTADISATHARLKQQGVNVSAIAKGKRIDQTGKLITWSIFFIDQMVASLPYPFFIQWHDSEAARLEDLTAQGLIAPQKAGNLIVEEAVFEVEDPETAAKVFSELLEQPFKNEANEWWITLQDQKFRFVKGPQNHLTTLVFSGATGNLKHQMLRFDHIQFQF